MHRETGSGNGFRAYSGGGSRVLISEVHDGETMQAMNGTGMKGEAFSGNKDGSFKGPESPQNYGFTSVVADAKKGKDGQIEESAEGFMSYLGGNRSLPICAIMDDRRHRLINLGKDAAKGAVAMHGLKEWGQQFLNTEDGMHMTGNKEKKIRISLVKNKNADEKQQQLSQQQQANGSGAGTSGNGGETQKKKPTGQKTLHKEETDIQIEQNGQSTTSQHGQSYSAQRGGSDSSTYTEDRKKSTQSTDKHTHIRFQDHRIFNDEEGNWATSPILVKKDPHCKE